MSGEGRMWLCIRKGPGAGTTIACERVRLSIGRSRANDIPLLGDWQVSRRHCEILRHGWHWMLVDVGSTNGTKVNGRPVCGPTMLHHGDVISMGETEIEVLMSEEECAGRTGFARVAVGAAALIAVCAISLAALLVV